MANPRLPGTETCDARWIDGDGDRDALWASSGEDTVAWTENLGGSFGTRRVVTTGAQLMSSVPALSPTAAATAVRLTESPGAALPVTL